MILSLSSSSAFLSRGSRDEMCAWIKSPATMLGDCQGSLERIVLLSDSDHDQPENLTDRMMGTGWPAPDRAPQPAEMVVALVRANMITSLIGPNSRAMPSELSWQSC
eukprot:scaffold133419_cov22-Prasinocladus_malaysianus.AAC.1